ncbi:single-stranded DNA-binding protein [Janibacter alkaliphilus]|uniref:Single-stranded DNA-binding protein n=1 Tax=Janibacter alkaliphilus TaxID=1069963 RepID=A0A852XD35_9MICO|nr:single-stranded DNA-binding protein [Janibacter alkaliphilus]NYG38623.1 single-strand DNA-binding protein [Janibacter alkaliphilus]
MNETSVTVVGRVVADPEHRQTRAGLQFTTFRVASTVRRRTKEGVFVDAGTSFYNVATYRSLGMNAHASVRKGDPVIVHGRQQVSSWQRSDGSWGSSVDIEAFSVGHDLTFGTTRYEKAVRFGSADGGPGGDAEDTAGDSAVDSGSDRPGERDEPGAQDAPPPLDEDEDGRGWQQVPA